MTRGNIERNSVDRGLRSKALREMIKSDQLRYSPRSRSSAAPSNARQLTNVVPSAGVLVSGRDRTRICDLLHVNAHKNGLVFQWFLRFPRCVHTFYTRQSNLQSNLLIAFNIDESRYSTNTAWRKTVVTVVRLQAGRWRLETIPIVVETGYR